MQGHENVQNACCFALGLHYAASCMYLPLQPRPCTSLASVLISGLPTRRMAQAGFSVGLLVEHWKESNVTFAVT